jgi:mono/diheme cytochrome c family protein
MKPFRFAARLAPAATLAFLCLAAGSAASAGDTPPAAAAATHAGGPALLSGAELAHADGEQVFRHVCQGCHMPDATGARGAGEYPALAGDPRLASARYMAATVLFGRRNMPSFSVETRLHGFEALTHVGLDDGQVAGVVNYVRTHFGNHYGDALTAEDVKTLHPAARTP